MFKNRPFVVINSTTKAVTLEVFWCNFHPFAIIFPIKFLRKKYVHFSSDFIPSHVFACIHIYIWIWWHILVGHLNFYQPRSGWATFEVGKKGVTLAFLPLYWHCHLSYWEWDLWGRVQGMGLMGLDNTDLWYSAVHSRAAQMRAKRALLVPF